MLQLKIYILGCHRIVVFFCNISGIRNSDSLLAIEDSGKRGLYTLRFILQILMASPVLMALYKIDLS